MNRCLPQRRDADRCPGVLALHQAEDGWLARIRLPGGRVSGSQLHDIAAVAAELGSGLVEITGRANLQVRGLPGDAGAELAERLAAAGLFPSAPHDRARNVLASPLAGRHPRSLGRTDAIVEALDRGIRAEPRLAELPGRFLIAVDDGTGLALARGADLALVATDGEGAAAFALLIAGTPAGEPVAAGDGAGLLLRAASAFLDARAEDDSAAWHLRELADGRERIAAAIDVRLRSEAGAGPLPDPATRPLLPGVLAQNDGRSAVTALAPLGRLELPTLRGLAELLAEREAEARLSTSRTVTVVDLPSGEATALAAHLERLDLIVEPASGWAGLSACAGVGYCAKARLDVRDAARRRADVRRAGAPAEHWSGCERRCGQPARVAAAVAPEDGSLAVDLDGERHFVRDVEAAHVALPSDSESHATEEEVPL
jgi:sulfite reductase beta subunit-like hemoprotein